MGSTTKIKNEQMIELRGPTPIDKIHLPGPIPRASFQRRTGETMEFKIRKHVPIQGERVLTVLENSLVKVDLLAALPTLCQHIFNNIERDSNAEELELDLENILGPTCIQALLRLMATQMAWKESKSGRIPWDSYPRSSPRVLLLQPDKLLSDKLHFDHNLDYHLQLHVDGHAETKSKSKPELQSQSQPKSKSIVDYPHRVVSQTLIGSSASKRETRKDALQDDLMSKRREGQEHRHEMILIQEEQDKSNSQATYGVKSKSKSNIPRPQESTRAARTTSATQPQSQTQTQNHKQSSQKQEQEQEQEQEQGKDEDSEKERKKQRLISFLEKDVATFTFLSDILNMEIEIDKSTNNTKDVKQEPCSSSSSSSSSSSPAVQTSAIPHTDTFTSISKYIPSTSVENANERSETRRWEEEQVDALTHKNHKMFKEKKRRKDEKSRNQKKNMTNIDRTSQVDDPDGGSGGGRENKGRKGEKKMKTAMKKRKGNEILRLIRTALQSKYEDHVRKALIDKDAKALMCMLSLVAHYDEEERQVLQERQERLKQDGDDRHTNRSHSNPITVTYASRQCQSSSSSSYHEDTDRQTNTHSSTINLDVDQPVISSKAQFHPSDANAARPLLHKDDKDDARESKHSFQMPGSHSHSHSDLSDSTEKETQMEKRQVKRHKVTCRRSVYGTYQHSHSVGSISQHRHPILEQRRSEANGEDKEVKECTITMSRDEEENDDDDVSVATTAPSSTLPSTTVHTSTSTSTATSALANYNLGSLFSKHEQRSEDREVDVDDESVQSIPSDIWDTLETDIKVDVDIKPEAEDSDQDNYFPFPQDYQSQSACVNEIGFGFECTVDTGFKATSKQDDSDQGEDKDEDDLLVSQNQDGNVEDRGKEGKAVTHRHRHPKSESELIRLDRPPPRPIDVPLSSLARSASKTVSRSNENISSTSASTNRFSWSSQNTNSKVGIGGTDTHKEISDISIWDTPMQYLEVKAPSFELLAITEEEVSMMEDGSPSHSSRHSAAKGSSNAFQSSSRNRSRNRRAFLQSGSPMPHEARETDTNFKTKEKKLLPKIDAAHEGLMDSMDTHSQGFEDSRVQSVQLRLQLSLEDELRKCYKQVISSLLQNPKAIAWIQQEQVRRALNKATPSPEFGCGREYNVTDGFRTFQTVLTSLKELMRDRLATDFREELVLQRKLKEHWKNEQRYLRELNTLKKDLKVLKSKHIPQMLTLDFQIRILNSRLREVSKESFQHIRQEIRDSELNAEVKMKGEMLILDQGVKAVCLKEKSSEILKNNYITEDRKFKQIRDSLNECLMQEIKRYDEKFYELQDTLDDIMEETLVYEGKVEKIKKQYEDIQSRFTDMKAEQKLKSILRRAKQADEAKRHRAAKLIQDTWKKYKIRKRKREKRLAKKGKKKKGGGKKKPEPGARDSESPASRSQSTSEVKSTPARSRQVSVVKSKGSSSLGSVG